MGLFGWGRNKKAKIEKLGSQAKVNLLHNDIQELIDKPQIQRWHSKLIPSLKLVQQNLTQIKEILNGKKTRTSFSDNCDQANILLRYTYSKLKDLHLDDYAEEVKLAAARLQGIKEEIHEYTFTFTTVDGKKGSKKMFSPEQIIIGRREGDLLIANNYISGKHVIITNFSEETFEVYSEGRNPTCFLLPNTRIDGKNQGSGTLLNDSMYTLYNRQTVPYGSEVSMYVKGLIGKLHNGAYEFACKFTITKT